MYTQPLLRVVHHLILMLSKTFKSLKPVVILRNLCEHVLGSSHTFSEQISKWKIDQADESREQFQKKGRHVLKTDSDGNFLCTACMLCVETCPVNCIQLKSGPAKKNNPRIREPLVFNLNSLECIFCGECVDVCPVDAIKLDPSYKLACHSGSVIVWSKEFMQER
jgi:formate hydrogenlyase subunit 6/NADH:ubiquinone oxidoreductase subunit I